MITFRITLLKVKGDLIVAVSFALYIGREGEKVWGRQLTFALGPAWPPLLVQLETKEDLT